MYALGKSCLFFLKPPRANNPFFDCPALPKIRLFDRAEARSNKSIEARAKSQPIAATRLLYSLQYPVQSKSSASDLSFPIFEITIRQLERTDRVAVRSIAICNAVLDW